MKRTKSLVLILTLLTVAMIPTGLFIFINAAPTASLSADPNDYYTGVYLESGLAGDVAMPEISEEFSADPLQMPKGAEASSGLQTAGGLQTASAEVGDVVFDWYLSVATNDPYMTLRAKVGKCEVWVANDLLFDPGDPRNAYLDNLTITDEMCEYLAAEVNSVIYPTDTTYFGLPNDRDGTGTIFEAIGWEDYYYNWTDTDDPQRVMIKVLNIRDEGYYDPTYPYFVIGFYSSGYTGYYNRNLIHLDCWQWWWRLGEDGTEWLPDLFVGDGHAFDYDSTTAHEYQHLIHRDYQPAPAAFMNEGCSMFAEFLCGYGISVSHVNSYMATPDNSLTVWGDHGGINILADYGVVALWTTYLSDHYGGPDIIRGYVQSGIPGIEGINAALAANGFTEDFYDVYRDWRLANLIRSGMGKYNYFSINLNDYDPIYIHEEVGLPVAWKKGTDYGTTITILGYDTGVSMLGPCSSDYIEFTNWLKPGVISFDGDDDAYLGWLPVPDGFWSGFGDEADKWLLGEAYVDPADPELTLVTMYDIEPFWDFGFVQVWNDTAGAWQSLENEFTTYDHDPGAYPAIIEELPGLTGESPGWDTEEWTTMTYDLSDWSGETVLVNFRYMTDWATTGAGWFIHEASVSGVPMDLEYEAAEADFLVSLVYEISTPWFTLYTTRDMMLNDMNEVGSMFAYSKYNVRAILVVSAVMEEGITDYAFAAN
ncbi:MAG: hypothetical protein ACFFB6_05795 [Promethearchaeota archaeon]